MNCDAWLELRGGRGIVRPMHALALPIAHLLLTGISVLVVAAILPGINVKNYRSALLFAFVLALLNAIVWTLLAPLSWLFTLLTLGIGMPILNTLLFLLAGRVVPGMQVSGCITAGFGALGLSLVNAAMRLVLGPIGPP